MTFNIDQYNSHCFTNIWFNTRADLACCVKRLNIMDENRPVYLQSGAGAQFTWHSSHNSAAHTTVLAFVD